MEIEGLEAWNDPALKAYLREIGKIAPTTAEEEQRLSRDLRSKDKAVRDAAAARLVSSHQPMLVKMAAAYRGRGMSLLDLIQEGTLGLYDALSKFDASRARFSTFSSWHVRNRLGLGVNAAPTVRQPLSAKRKAKADEGESAPSTKRRGGYAPSHVSMVHIETPIGEELTIGDTLADPNAVDPIELRSDSELGDMLAAALSSLDARERAVIEARFGFDRDEEETLAMLSDRFGISRERVRQIEAKALAKLKASPQAAALESLLD